MVSERVTIRDEKRGLKIFLKVFLILVVGGILSYSVFYTITNLIFKNEKSVLENPLHLSKVEKNSSNFSSDILNIDINSTFVDYILVELGVNRLHKSVSFENPKIKMKIGDSYWFSEIVKGNPKTEFGEKGGEDILIKISKENFINILVSDNSREYIVDSVKSGNIAIEKVAGDLELYSKGYLDLYESF